MLTVEVWCRLRRGHRAYTAEAVGWGFARAPPEAQRMRRELPLEAAEASSSPSSASRAPLALLPSGAERASDPPVRPPLGAQSGGRRRYTAAGPSHLCFHERQHPLSPFVIGLRRVWSDLVYAAKRDAAHALLASEPSRAASTSSADTLAGVRACGIVRSSLNSITSEPTNRCLAV